MRYPNYFGSMMVKFGNADALISGLTTDYPTTKDVKEKVFH